MPVNSPLSGRPAPPANFGVGKLAEATTLRELYALPFPCEVPGFWHDEALAAFFGNQIGNLPAPISNRR